MRALRAADATKRRREVEEHRAQRLRQKEIQFAAEISKRSLEDNALNQPAKRIRSTTSHRRHTGDTYKRPSQVNRTVNGDSKLSVSEGKVQATPIGTQTQIEGAFA